MFIVYYNDSEAFVTIPENEKATLEECDFLTTRKEWDEAEDPQYSRLTAELYDELHDALDDLDTGDFEEEYSDEYKAFADKLDLIKEDYVYERSECQGACVAVHQRNRLDIY